ARAVLGGFVYFAADNGTDGVQLWRSDGTPTGTTVVHDVAGEGVSGAPRVALAKVLFTGVTAAAGAEPWVSDGTTTTNLVDINVGVGNSSPREFVAVGGLAFFRANAGSDNELWTTDGTTVGTTRVRNINSAGNDSVGLPAALP